MRRVSSHGSGGCAPAGRPAGGAIFMRCLPRRRAPAASKLNLGGGSAAAASGAAGSLRARSALPTVTAGFERAAPSLRTRLVRLGGRALAAAKAHLRYIQRDGVTRDGEPGRLYSAAQDDADGKGFLERCGGDRHHFRLIVSAEDGAEYEDLRPLVRRFMARMEEDLGTRLDWVAADHLDTLHPHSHVILRGKDERGVNLVIAPDYIRHGMRERLAGLVSIDLGPRTDLEIERRLRLEVEAERVTSIDRRLLRDMDSGRIVAAGGRDMVDHALRTGRLRKLGSLGLAEELGHGRWRLAEELEPVLRSLGERGDIIRTLQRALKAAGVDRGQADQLIFRLEGRASVTGRLVARGLADELRDHHYLVIDGVDGRSHYVAAGKGDAIEPLGVGAIVRITPRAGLVRASDERIAAIAQRNGGRYSPDVHLAAEPGTSMRFAKAHVRRLGAIRRSVGGVGRAADGSWSIPPDFLELARRHEERLERDRPVEVELLSSVPLERLPAHDGATWLDRELASDEQWPRDCGFGRDLRSALALRRAWLIGQGLAAVEDGRVSFRPDLIEVLERRELSRVADALGRETGLDYSPGKAGPADRRGGPAAAGSCLGALCNDRQWPGILARALASGARARARQAGARQGERRRRHFVDDCARARDRDLTAHIDRADEGRRARAIFPIGKDASRIARSAP